MAVELGDKVKDSVTGFTGVAIGRTQWLYGCDRIIVQPPVGKDGKLGETGQFDEPSLVVIAKKKVTVKKVPGAKTGGFNITPMQNRA